MTGPRMRDEQRLECDCWCGLVILEIPAQMVRDGLTASCGEPGCSEDGKVLERAEDADRGDLLTRDEAAAVLGVSPESVRKLVLPSSRQRSANGTVRNLYDPRRVHALAARKKATGR